MSTSIESSRFIESSRDRVVRVHDTLYTLHDTDTIESDFSPDYIDHSPLIADGLHGVKTLVGQHPLLCHEIHRVLVDGDLVALHGRYCGLGDRNLVGFDIYRVEHSKIVEHWAGLVPEAHANASGRTQLDGPCDPGSDDDTEWNRDRIVEFFTRTLINNDYEGFRRYTDGHAFIQHSPDIADGVDTVIAFLEQLETQGLKLEYSRLHRTVADGQFVLTHSEGSIGDVRHAYFELWRMQEGNLVEMWDVIAPVPTDEEAVHQNGIF
ncbi:MAG: nuclear transport factor 2 family protein [Burkholderiaceae bacterium]|nr:nuclear transport factor 2 family protein [Burkholderiaceae bacterium]